MSAWQTVGKRGTCSKVFGGAGGFADEFPELEKVKSIAPIKAIVEQNDHPLRAVLEASWFSILSQSELSTDDLSEVLLMVELVQDRTSPSSELSEFLVQTLNHVEMKSVLKRLLQAGCYQIEHLMVMCRYIERVEACLNKDPTIPKEQFKGIALLFFRDFSKREQATEDVESYNLTATYVNHFLEGFETQEFEERFIEGYPSGYSPPDNFRYISTFPRTQDVEGGLPFLRPNIKKGAFRSLDDYLDIQYRLLREEYMAGLRNGIRELRKENYSHDVVSFTGSRIWRHDFADEFGTISLRITSNGGRMQEFKSGVLVALARDGLNSFIYATFLDADYGSVKLELCNPNDGLSFKPSAAHQVLVLKSAYYEAFRHTLDALKSITQLPFQSYIVDCVSDPGHPQHWKRADQRKLLQENRPLMNESQLRAFCQTFLRKVCLVQGPPGTGKTYVGLRIVESILKYQVTEYPVLVVCYTNHALDQFLEGMLHFTDSIVRMGGRSKSEKLLPYSFDNLKNEKQKKTWLSKEDKKKKADSSERIEKCRKWLQEDETLLGVIQGRTFYQKSELVKLSAEFSKIPDCSEFLEVAKLCKEYEAKKELLGNPPAPSDEVDAYISLRMCSSDITERVIADRMSRSRILNRYAFTRITEKVQHKYCKKGEKPRQPLTLNEKWRFYATLHWKKVTEDSRVNLTEDDLKDPLRMEQKRQAIGRRLAERHRQNSQLLAEDTYVVNQLRAKQTAAILRSKRIIGLTTTGAAKRRSLLHELNCEIIVVEEAAEILESHLVAILPQKTQQMILIGDHKQLSPCINNYTLEKSFNLGVSLFERLINNGMPYVMLNVQHRMKNDFLKLLVPHIYDNITSSPKVFELESIRGMSKDLQFLSHKFNERKTGHDSASKSNSFEASMIVALLNHLAYQGYTSQDIVILCAYAGQQQYVSDLLKQRVSGESPRVSTIDDYQGEECDIVIVSFVRCNPQNEIGFLAKPNRVCVALSRARKGLFCFGDFEAYATRSSVWKGILGTLQGLGAVNRFLELKCAPHGTLAQVCKPEDFARHMPLGRCRKICDSLLKCGHQCQDPCHLNDPHPICRQTCLYKFSGCGHPCQKRCYQDHGICEEIVPKLLKCGHTVDAPCGEPDAWLQCHVRCIKELDCGHQCGELCSKPCTQNCMFRVPITRECGHDAAVACYMREQQLSQKFCKTRVYIELNCGHRTEVQCCRTMEIEKLSSSCTSPVANVALPCGHIQNMICMEHQRLDSYSCRNPVEVELQCGHPKQVSCFEATDAMYLAREMLRCETGVPITATCGHSFNIACRQAENAAQFCDELVEVELACGHSRLTACKTARNEYQLRRMEAACVEVIFVEASCGHLVEIPCNKRKDGAFLRASCRVIITVTAPCNHQVNVVCPSSLSPAFVLRLCRKGKTVTLECNHTMDVECSDTRSVEDMSKDCRQRVENILKCNHVVEQVCSGTLGDLQVKCKQACKFVHRCGHTCTGNCAACRAGMNHRPCRLNCPQTLPCGHPCKGKCGRKCTPCQAPCQRRCAHGQCEKKCGEPCSSRSQTCRKRGGHHCTHQDCGAKTCWECTCEPCKEKCNKELEQCHHRCEGMCGEPCLPQCFRCKPKLLQRMFGKATVSGRFLRVPGCDHLVDAEIMDQVMANWKVGIPRCITCDADIPFWKRYNSVYNRGHRNARPDQKRQPDSKSVKEELLGKIEKFQSKLSSTELREDTEDREMALHYACQILADLSFRLKRARSEDVMLCELVFQVVEELMEAYENVLRAKDSFPQNHSLRRDTFILSRNIFEDLAAMVDMQPDETSSWTLSTLDDISTQALRLKFIGVLPSIATNLQDRLLEMIFSGGRFSLPDANALIRQSNSKLRIQPFYDFKVRQHS